MFFYDQTLYDGEYQFSGMDFAMSSSSYMTFSAVPANIIRECPIRSSFFIVDILGEINGTMVLEFSVIADNGSGFFHFSANKEIYSCTMTLRDTSQSSLMVELVGSSSEPQSLTFSRLRIIVRYAFRQPY